MHLKIKLYFLLILFHLFCSCSKLPLRNFTEINDLKMIPQTSSTVINNLPKSFLNSQNKDLYIKNFKRLYFNPWRRHYLIHSAEMVFPNWLKPEELYRHNYKPVNKNWFNSVIENANFKNFGRINKPGIITDHTALHTLPLKQPLFKSSNLAGEGFPFTYIEADHLTTGTPVRISHFSTDKAWVFVDTASNTFGWIKANRIAYVDKLRIKKYSSLPLVVFHTDNKSVLNKYGTFLFSTRIGMAMPYLKKDKEHFYILYPAKNKKGYASFNKIKLSKKLAADFPMQLNKQNLSSLFSKLIGNIYCWGAQHAGRDCSKLTKDYAAVFGCFIYRNSINQINNGSIIDISKLSDQEKLSVIKKRAIPFASLFYLKGHIMLYTGLHQGEPLVLHNTWAVKTRKGDKTGRNIIGKTVLTTLKPGIELENFDKEKGTLLKQMTKIIQLNLPINPDFEFNLVK